MQANYDATTTGTRFGMPRNDFAKQYAETMAFRVPPLAPRRRPPPPKPADEEAAVQQTEPQRSPLAAADAAAAGENTAVRVDEYSISKIARDKGSGFCCSSYLLLCITATLIMTCFNISSKNDTRP